MHPVHVVFSPENAGWVKTMNSLRSWTADTVYAVCVIMPVHGTYRTEDRLVSSYTMHSVHVMNVSGTVSWPHIFFLKKCLNAVSARNVCALLHHLREGTYVPSVKNRYMDLLAFLMVMILQSPSTIDAFLPWSQQRSYFVNPYIALQHCSSYSTIYKCFSQGYWSQKSFIGRYCGWG